MLAAVACLGAAAACSPLPGLEGVSSVAVSPDGRNVYASAYGSGTVFALPRSASGRLSRSARVEVVRAAGIAISPGGGDVYVASATGLTRFSRSLEAEASAPVPGASAVAVGPDGSDVYVAAGDGATLTRFRR